MIEELQNRINGRDFSKLRHKIFDFQHWDSKVFEVFPYEAGSGKSLTTHHFLAELAIKTNHRVLYVQLFSSDGRLQETVDRINKKADKNVAVKFDGEDSKKSGMRKTAIEAQILCITHNMYFSVCQGEHPELIQDREILIIDEFPNIMHPITVTLDDISRLFTYFQPYSLHETMVRLGHVLSNKYWNYYHPSTIAEHRNVMRPLFLEDQDRKEFLEAVQQLAKDIEKKEANSSDKNEENASHEENEEDVGTTKSRNPKVQLLHRIEMMLTNPSYFYQQSVYTYDHRYQLVRLENNIILDANGYFETRYTMSPEFHVNFVSPKSDYSTSTFVHIKVKTNQYAYHHTKHLHQNILSKITFEPNDHVLLVTSKKQKEQVEKHAQQLNQTTYPNVKFEVDYFGHLLGKNDYREANVVVLLVTPNFPYVNYFLNYLYFSKKTIEEMDSVKIFKHQDTEEIRKHTLAGEFYQAIRRINRSNQKPMHVYVATSRDDVVEKVQGQFPKIQCETMDLTEMTTTKSKRERQHDDTQHLLNVLLKHRDKNYETVVQKDTVKSELGLENREDKFYRIIRKSKPILEKWGINTEHKVFRFT